MKTTFLAAAILAMLSLGVLHAQESLKRAEVLNEMPPEPLTSIKAKCAAKSPDDLAAQADCVISQSTGWLALNQHAGRPENINACAFSGLPPIVYFNYGPGPQTQNVWAQVGNLAPVEINVAAGFWSWDTPTDSYYFVGTKLSVTNNKTKKSKDYLGECSELNVPKQAQK